MCSESQLPSSQKVPLLHLEDRCIPSASDVDSIHATLFKEALNPLSGE